MKNICHHVGTVTMATKVWMRHVHGWIILFKVIPLFSVPLTEPLDFKILGEQSHSVNLSWKSIPIGNLRGFLSHYRLCSIKLYSEEKEEGTEFLFHHDYFPERFCEAKGMKRRPRFFLLFLVDVPLKNQQRFSLWTADIPTVVFLRVL